MSCPTSTSINLSKYVDSRYYQSINWTPSSSFISGGINDGRINNAASLNPGNTYKYEYNVISDCAAGNGNVYLTIIRDDIVYFVIDEVKICFEHAIRINLNAMFGLEAGGTWTTTTTGAAAYIQTITGLPFDGQSFFRGKDAWDNNIGTPNGANKEINLTYTPAITSCLSGKTYNVKIILTPDITN
jgi:hypothetical protein